jgi:hypothetical protein
VTIAPGSHACRFPSAAVRVRRHYGLNQSGSNRTGALYVAASSLSANRLIAGQFVLGASIFHGRTVGLDACDFAASSSCPPAFGGTSFLGEIIYGLVLTGSQPSAWLRTRTSAALRTDCTWHRSTSRLVEQVQARTVGDLPIDAGAHDAAIRAAVTEGDPPDVGMVFVE